MHRKTTLALTALVALMIPAAAQAHHLTTGDATCTTASASYASFSESNKPITYKVFSDNVQVATGTGTFPGSSGTITANYLPLAAGSHVIKWVATWPNQGSANGNFEKTVAGCTGPPVVQTVAPATAPATAPAAAPAPAPVETVTTAPITSAIGTAIHIRHKAAKRCEFGRRQYDRHGHRLRDSHGRRISLCKRPPQNMRRQGATVAPQLTG